MSRLIDADLLKKNIAKWLQGSDPQETRMVQVEDIAVSVCMEIEEQPTAFDTKKVVEQLEEKKAKFQKEMEYCIFKGLPYHDSLEGQIIGIIDAIDIVKKGGME